MLNLRQDKMSDSIIKKINCPNCSNKIEVQLWESINAQISPEVRDALLRGRIHVFDCPICKKSFNVNKAFLYHDMKRKLLVWYLPFSGIEHRTFFSQFYKDGRLKVNKALEGDVWARHIKNVHYVFSMDELARYILFREKLADTKGGSRIL